MAALFERRWPGRLGLQARHPTERLKAQDADGVVAKALYAWGCSRISPGAGEERRKMVAGNAAKLCRFV